MRIQRRLEWKNFNTGPGLIGLGLEGRLRKPKGDGKQNKVPD